jgi:alkanesulfonate monooxygenase SsuD/methylene tetrahydromethanopterin reductase-like flavin-dependent oxidoreductase (luciferase family)
MKVRFAVSAGARPPVPERLHLMVTEAEKIGFNTLWFSDLTILPSTDPILSIAQAAAWTTRIRLGMTIVPFGYTPYTFARQVAQLDQLSNGRLRLMLVPGLRKPGEGAALGIDGHKRAALIEERIPQLRALWSGAAIPGSGAGGAEIPALAIPPMQAHLQIWLGGNGPKAYDRVGYLADGWRGGMTNIARAAEIVQRINQAAETAGRTFNPDHFGLTVGYAREDSDVHHHGPLGEEPSANGRKGLRDLIKRLNDAGLSKFSLRRVSPVKDWSAELAWLADAVLDLEAELSS